MRYPAVLSSILRKPVMDTVINVVPNAAISKTQKITFFSFISKILVFASQHFIRIYMGVLWDHPVQKLGVF